MLSPACLVGPAQHLFVSTHAQLLALIARDSHPYLRNGAQNGDYSMQKNIKS